jgi:hypothetical protein
MVLLPVSRILIDILSGKSPWESIVGGEGGRKRRWSSWTAASVNTTGSSFVSAMMLVILHGKVRVCCYA